MGIAVACGLLNASLIARTEPGLVFVEVLLPLTLIQSVSMGVILSVCATAFDVTPQWSSIAVAISVLVSIPTARIVERSVFLLINATAIEGGGLLLQWMEDNIFMIDGVLVVATGSTAGIVLLLLPKTVRIVSNKLYA